MPAYFLLTVILAILTGFIVAFFLRRRAKHSNELRDELLVLAMHKLRTPLTEIRWAASELERAQNSRETQTIGAEILTSSTRILGLVDELLQSVQLENGSYEYRFEPCDVKEIAQKILAEQQGSLARKRLHASLHCDIAKPLIRADKMKLMDVIRILVENSISYTHEGNSIDVTIARHNKDFYIIRVRDSGIGVEKNDLEHLFTRRYRGRNAISTSTEGLGLGLFMAKEIVRRHKGTIGVDSEGNGMGATFWFTIPKVD